MDTTNSALPEEILELIISCACLPDFTGDGFAPIPSALALPLVCKAFNRIAKPFLYSYVHLQTRSQSDKLADLLSARPAVVAYIRGIRVDGPSASRAFLVAAQVLSEAKDLPRRVLAVVDVKLASERGLPSNRNLGPNQVKEDLARLNSALSICPETRCLIIRQDAFVGWNSAISFAHSLGSCVSRWRCLESVDLRMKPTPVPAPPGSPRPDPLAAALAKAPRLRVLRARQPTLLNNFLLDVATNPALKRIELLNNTEDSPDSCNYFWPFLSRPLGLLEKSDRNDEADLFLASTPKEFRSDESGYKRVSGDIGLGPQLLAAAVEELEAQLSNEPQTLFASQMVAHPRLCELVRAGRLRLIMERLLMSRSKRCLGGDCNEESKYKFEALPSLCHYADQKFSDSCCNGCLHP